MRQMCCTETQWSFMIAYPAVSVAILLLWGSVILRPLRIFSVVLHEFSHGVAVLLSCGTIHDVSVDRFEGGLIKWSPRCTLFTKCTFPIIAAAGYLGVSVFGTVLLLSIGLPEWRESMLRVFACLLVVASFISSRRTALRFESTWMFFFGILACIASMRPFATFTWYYVLFSSSMLCIYAANDVYDDTIRRSFDDSDASHFAVATLGNVSHSKCIGRLWYFICNVLHLLAIIFTTLFLGGGTPIPVRDVSSSHFIVCVWGLLLAAVLSGIDAFRLRAPGRTTVDVDSRSNHG